MTARPRPLRDRYDALPQRQRSLFAAACVAIGVWVAFMTDLLLRTPAGDYAVYRALAPAAFDGRGLYEARLGPLAFTYPAFAAAPLSLLAKVGFGLGLFLLTVASLAALARVVVLLARAASRERGVPVPVDRMVLIVALLAAALWFAPVTKTLLNGQINLILLWLVVEDLVGDVPPRWRGVLTGIATGIKLTPGLFLVAMLVTGRRAWAARGGATVAATIAIGFVLEPSGSLEYWRHLGGGDGYGNPLGYGNQSLLYALVRLFGGEYQAYLPVAIVLVAAAMVLAHRLGRQGRDLGAWGVTAIAMLAVAPISWTHHWVWMFLPVAALIAYLPVRAGGRALLGVSVLVLISSAVSLAPRLHLDGLARTLVIEPLGNAYLLVGLAFLVWFGLLAFGRPGHELSEVPATIGSNGAEDPAR